MIGVQISVKERPNEEQIRTRLRELTEQSRRLREELSDMMGRETPMSRRFLHQPSWPKQPSQLVAAEKPRRKSRTNAKKSGKE